MDDDPEPTFDQMILENREGRERPLSFEEQKFAADIGEENAMESGDIGPVVDPESPKKFTAAKDLPDQTESKTSIFRRKEWRDQGQPADLSSSVKSSTTCLRKPASRTSQRLVDQDSRWSGQQPASQQPLLCQKPSRAQAINDTNVKDPIWVNQRTGKIMKCRSQQTSLIWERKALSEILHLSSSESTPSREEESEFTTTEYDITSSVETASERSPGQESRHGSKQLERKASKHSSLQHLERFGSRRCSQRSGELPFALGPKSSQVLPPIKGTDTDKDITWISQRTGREMTCKAQQTSRVWEARMLSVCSSGPDSQSGRDKETGSSTTDEVTSSGETGMEEPTAQGLHRSSQQLEGSVSKQSSRQQLGRSGTRRSSQQTMEPPYLLNLKSSREEFTKEMKCKSQQTSLIWEHKTLSDILNTRGQASEASGVGEEDTTEDEEGGTKMDQATVKDAQHHIQHLEAEESRQDIQQAEELKPGHRRKKCTSKIDQAQQTDSVESIKKELAESSQQTDVFESRESSLVDLDQDPGYGTEQAGAEGSRQSSQGLVGQDSRCSSPEPECRDFQSSSQQSLNSKTQTAEEDVPSDVENEPPKLPQKASSIRGMEETIWVSRKTGRMVRNQSQQTDRSWLQYFALKSQKLKRCISQQTEESFLWHYKTSKLKQAFKEHRKSHVEQDVRRCTLCGDLYGEDFLVDMDMLSSFSSMSTLSAFSNLETARAENAEEQEASTRGGDDEQPEMQPPLQQESQRGSQEVCGQETPKDVWRESRQGTVQAVDDQILARGPDDFESHTESESSSLYTEEENKIQQTYSIISFEDGIWLNRKTGKLLVSHSQQTSKTSVSGVSGMALEKSGSTAEEGLAPADMDDGSAGVNQDFQQEMEADGRPSSGQESRRGSQQDQNVKSHPVPVQPTGEGFQSADEVEKLVCSRLSEATLLSVESPDAEDGPVQMYTAVSLEKGTWMNVVTGKLLTSQSQQTEASSQQNSAEDEESVTFPGHKSPEEGQVDTP